MKSALLGDVFFDNYFKLLSIPGISSDPGYDAQLQESAHFVANWLTRAGLTCCTLSSGRAPILFGEKAIDPTLPTLLFYGHYDVQPVDPLDLWESDPFTPVLKKDRIYARGAQDNKGQLSYMLWAIETFLKKEARPQFNIKVIVEGEEESGSTALTQLLQERESDFKEKLKADLLCIVDCGIHHLDTPAIELGFRGLITFDLVLRNGNTDHHSGGVGGAVYNPNLALCQLMASCYDKDGTVTLPDFYKGVKIFSEEEKKLFDFEFDEKAIREKSGVGAFFGDKSFSLGERITIRPTLEINGIHGGYSGEGFKTVLPAEARLKLSCRLVEGQDPHFIEQSVKKGLMERLMPGFTLTITTHSKASAVQTNPKSHEALWISSVYQKVFHKRAPFILGGGSIPITALLHKVSGAPFIGIGFGHQDDHIHAPNESFSIGQLEMGYRAILGILESFRYYRAKEAL